VVFFHLEHVIRHLIGLKMEETSARRTSPAYLDWGWSYVRGASWALSLELASVRGR
jgi:hypothetical protein